MEDPNTSWTVLNGSFSIRNEPEYEYEYEDTYDDIHFIMEVITWIIISVGLPLTLLAIYFLYSLVRSDQLTPVYVINLLLSDLLQLCCLVVLETTSDRHLYYAFHHAHEYALMASVGFMLAVAVERCLVISCPLWFRFKRTVRTSVYVCVGIWTFPLVLFLSAHFCPDHKVPHTLSAVYLLVPLPLFFFVLARTLRSLKHSRSVSAEEKRRIAGTLALVLVIYTLLFLPYIASVFFYLLRDACAPVLCRVADLCFKLSPLADLMLYIFMRKGATDRLCGCRGTRENSSSSSI